MHNLHPLLPITPESQVFEGPEKKLDIYFRPAAPPEGLRHFTADTWAELLKAASCSILSKKDNERFDAYLLSESSLFVFPHRVILKTCGTTTLLLVLPQLIRMADFLGSSIELIQYGHLRYKFPHQQIYPHSSLTEEHSYLSQFFSQVSHSTLGPSDGISWSMFAADGLPRVEFATAAEDGDEVLEIAMEGLSLDVCSLFSRNASDPSGGVPERDLATRMTERSGLRELLPEVAIDDWAFEPCGYSMNGLRLGYYYTVHVTPEPAFSYASFETNDPAYRDPRLVQRIVSAFAPTVAVVTLTTRGGGGGGEPMPSYALRPFDRTSFEVKSLGAAGSVCCANYVRTAAEAEPLAKTAPAVAAAALEAQPIEAEPMAPVLGGAEHGAPACNASRAVEVA